MTLDATFNRISADPEILGGKPCVRGTRLSVEFLLELVAEGATRDDIVATYPALSADDVRQAISYAARFLRNEVVVTTRVGR